MAQRALLDAKFGNFVLETRPVHKPGRGEILVKVRATAMNPVDGKTQKYGIFIDEFPAGNVEELGEGVTDFKIGDRV